MTTLNLLENAVVSTAQNNDISDEVSAALTAFLKERCELSPDFREGKKDFYDQFLAWSVKNAFAPASIYEVSQQMKRKKFVEVRTKEKRFWTGLRLKIIEEESNSIAERETPVEDGFVHLPPLQEEQPILRPEPCHELLRKNMGLDQEAVGFCVLGFVSSNRL